jgi:HlyD family type I secretion membrane fusion protein
MSEHSSSPPSLPNDALPTVWHEPAFSGKVIMMGFLYVTLFIWALTMWMMFAPLQNAVVASGIINVESHRKQVQHFEGGIIESILVRDGDHVKQGQPLAKLRDVQQKTELRQLKRRHLEVEAVIARLQAERVGSETITFPDSLLARQDDADVAAVLEGQRILFDTRRRLFAEQQSVLAHKISQQKEEITGMRGQVNAKSRERTLLRKEVKQKRAAVEKGLLPESEALQLEQRLARLDGDISEYKARQESLHQSILEIRLNISELKTQHASDINEQLHEQQALLYDLSQKIVKAKDVQDRTHILSPIDGIVVNLRVHTSDGVIKPGQVLMDIVPSKDELVVYAYIRPEEIRDIHTGMQANLKLSSLSLRGVPLTGEVASISADRVTSEYNKQGYFQAQIKLEPKSHQLVQNRLVSGMGVEVYILTGARSALDYLLSPILQSMSHSLKEK